MLKNAKIYTGFAALLLGLAVFLPQVAEARIVCHHGYGWHKGHCIRVHHHRHHHR